MSEKLKEKLSSKVNSEVLLNIKDIERLKAENLKAKQDDKLKTLNSSIEKFNKAYISALEAPIPNIKLHFTEVLTRAVPVELKSKGGLILHTGLSDARTISKLEYMSDKADNTQEILMVGDMLIERGAKIKPGDIAVINFKRFRELEDDGTGVIKTAYQIPTFTIDGYKYLIIDQRDIIYTKEK